MMRSAPSVIWAGLLATAIVGCGTSSPPKVGAPSTTIEKILAVPILYSGKQVTLEGQLDQCAGWECSLCPKGMTTETADPKKCLPLSFRSLIPGTGFGSGGKEKVLRFSDVVLSARFDPTCMTPGRCYDRQVVLYDADVLSVSRRRSSRSGLWLGPRSPLTEVGEPTSNELRKAAYEAGFPDNPPFKAFATVGKDPQYVACWTYADSPQSWPDTLEGALSAPSTMDFYHCYAARKVSDRWVIQVYE